jgi:N,N'-diacetylchitobiose phosphorylase
MKGVKELYINGEKVDAIPVMGEGTTHQVKVILG